MIWFRADFLIPITFYGFIVFIFLMGKKRGIKKDLKRMRSENSRQNCKDISVVIPFRNEEKCLGHLLQSLTNLKTYPLEFIFVNDHSTDDSIRIIENFNTNFQYQILELPKGEFGKKSALRFGINSAMSDYILTWDADIEVSPLFFDKLCQFSWIELMILPVEMKWKSWVQGFFAWDYQLQVQTSLALSGYGKYITASGANLFFEKRLFWEMEQGRTDQNIASGDDQFLLAICKKNNKQIHFFSDYDLIVKTNSPTTIAEGLMQRSRWLKKTTLVKDNFATSFGIFVLFVQMAFYAIVCLHLVSGKLLLALLLLLLKGELDGILSGKNFQKKISTFQGFWFTLFFPIYMICLLCFSSFRKNTWKNRPIP